MYRILVILLFLPAAARADDGPNVLLIVSDDLAACLGCYGNDACHTPHLDRLAAEGVVFDRAYCQYPLCGPSRASFMSGLYPNNTLMLGNSKAIGSFRTTNPALADHPSIGGLLRQNGFVSLRVSKIYHMGVPGGIEAGEPGGDDPASWDRAFDIMAPETASPGKLELLSPKRHHYGSNFARILVPDSRIATQADYLAAGAAVAILENRARGRRDSGFLRPEQPFFLAVGFVRPHVPLVAPRRIFEQYPHDDIKLPPVPQGDLDDIPPPAAAMENSRRYGMNNRQQRQAIAAYYASVSFMDEQVGRLLGALDRLKLRRNTIIIFTSDHGYNLGEHHCWQKLSLFDESARVPLVISAPGFEAAAGKRCDALVELVDLYPTIADLAGLASAAPRSLQGASLRKYLQDPEQSGSRRAAYTISHRNGESIRTDRWRYTRWGESGEELYDHESDPHEFTNLAGNSRHTGVLHEMRQLLRETRSRSRQ